MRAPGGAPAHLRARRDYWPTVGELSAEAYWGESGEWYGAQGLELMGHMWPVPDLNVIPVGVLQYPVMPTCRRRASTSSGDIGGKRSRESRLPVLHISQTGSGR